jgi:hypothetical protein
MFVGMLQHLFSSRVKSLSTGRRAVFCLVGFAANVFLLSGCAGSVNTDKPAGASQPGAPQAPQIVVTPNALTFQNVIVGQKNTQTVQISNTGNAELNVSSISLTGAGFSLGSIAVPLQIAPGANKSFTVSFAPAAVTSSAKATISIASNDGALPVSIGVQGTAINSSASWEIAPGSITFRSLAVQSSESLDIQLTNNGNTAVTVNSVHVTGSGFSSSGLNAGTVISPNQGIHFTVTFHPVAAGNAMGTLQLTGSSVSPLSVNLAGSAANSGGPGSQPQPHSVTLTWNDNGSGIAGYRVYRGTNSGGPYVGINSSLIPITSYVDSSVASGSKYFYVATSVDASGNESAYSNEASATVPNP